MRVEFCGVPAAGKSTLCGVVVKALRARGIEAANREDVVERGLRARDFGVIGNLCGRLIPAWRRHFLGLPHGLNDWHRFAVEHADFVALLHEWLAVSGTDSSWRDPVFRAVLTSGFEFQLAKQLDGIVVLDEGFAHRFFSLRGYRGLGKPADAERYAALLPAPDVLICVDTPADVCVERVQGRGQPPVLFGSEPVDKMKTRFQEGATLLNALADALEGRGVPVLRASGISNLDAEAQRIAEFIVSQHSRAKGSR